MIELKVNNQIYAGWQRVRIPFGIEQIANSFELTVTDRWHEGQAPRVIKMGSACEVLIDGQRIIKGYVDDVLPMFNPDAHSVSVNGRDATGDLVDCSAIYKTGQWRQVSLHKIVSDLCRPFGISVVVDAEIANKFSTFSLHEGETAFEAIERACRMRAVLAVSDSQGNLRLTRAKRGTPIASLIEGENLLSARGHYSMRDRFSAYTVKSQDRSSEDWNDTSHTKNAVTFSDTTVNRYRPLIILAEEKSTHGTLKKRAQWEASVRQGRGTRVTLTVQGWHNANQQLWQANTIVQVKSPSLGIDANLLVAGGVFSVDETQGKRTELTCYPKQALDLIATPEEKTKQRKQSGNDFGIDDLL